MGTMGEQLGYVYSVSEMRIEVAYGDAGGSFEDVREEFIKNLMKMHAVLALNLTRVERAIAKWDGATESDVDESWR